MPTSAKLCSSVELKLRRKYVYTQDSVVYRRHSLVEDAYVSGAPGCTLDWPSIMYVRLSPRNEDRVLVAQKPPIVGSI